MASSFLPGPLRCMLHIKSQSTNFGWDDLGRSFDRAAGGRLESRPLAFIAVCVVYFLVCRRLSLATEWVFLIGFAAALPIAIFSALASQSVETASGRGVPLDDGLLLGLLLGIRCRVGIQIRALVASLFRDYLDASATMPWLRRHISLAENGSLQGSISHSPHGGGGNTLAKCSSDKA